MTDAELGAAIGASSARERRTGDGRKDDDAKDRWDLLPWGAVREVVRVLTWGAKHYAPHNWKHVPEPRERYLAAIHRHLVERFEDGQRRDEKTSLHHLAHVVSNALFLLWFDLTDDLVVDPGCPGCGQLNIACTCNLRGKEILPKCVACGAAHKTLDCPKYEDKRG